MPTYRITAPDGKTYDVTGPEGSTPEQALEQVKAQLSKPAAPAAVRAGRGLMEIPRQVGLAARYGAEGLAQVGDIIHEPIRALVNIGSGDKPRAGKSLTQMVSGLADDIGLPAPENANERVIGDASRMVAGVGGLAGAAGTGSKITTGLTQKAMNLLAASPGKQAISAATGGLAGGSVREAGGSPLEQFGASLLGGLAGGGAAVLGERGMNAAKSALTPKATQLQQADQQIALVLERQGINWQDVPERIRQSMRAEAAQALQTGSGLNGDALRRLLVMQRAGVTPTVGQLTQDPGLITREMNLAKTGANSTDPSLQRLAGIQNQNTRNLLTRLDEAGAANALSAPDTARSAIGSLEGTAGRAQSQINDLYSRARDTAGRSLPLEGGTFTRRASQLIDEAMVGGALPKGVESTLNKIATGEMPLTVEISEQLKTQMGKLQRATNDGQARYALGLVRQALDEAPLQTSPAVNPGSLPAVPGTVPPSAQTVGQESINAFNEARGAHRAFMQRVEANPALRAVVDGVEPDQFVSRYVLSKQASAADVATLRNDLNPESAQTIRNFIVKHLRDAATNSTDDITKFSDAAYRKALRDIGDEKLSVFFTPEERQLLQDVGDAAKYMKAQPDGSAVNNSNSAAMAFGRGLDMLQTVAQKLPLGLRDVISGTIQGQQQRQVLTPANALALPAATSPPANFFSLPLLAGSASAQGGNDDGRDKRAKKDRVN